MAGSAARTSAGTILSIGSGDPATYDESGFSALTYDPVAEITDLGEFGREYNLVTHNPVANRRTVKRKGSYNDGSMTLQMARAISDAGQAALKDASESDSSYPIKIELQDGTTFYFTCQVMSYKTGLGNVDQITAATAVLEIDNDIVEVAAA